MLGEFATLTKEEREAFYKQRICVPTPSEHAHLIERVQVVQGYISLEGYRSVLDVGCHDGFTTRWLASEPYDIDRVVGIDLCEEAIKHARELGAEEDYPERLTYHLMSWEAYDKENPTEEFDAVIGFELLEHFPEEEGRALVRFMHKHMAPGGRAFMSTPDPAGQWGTCNPEREHIRLYTAEEMAQLIFAETGVTPTIARTPGHLFIATWSK